MAQSVLAYITGGMILITALLIFSKPLKSILKIIVHSAIGCVAIFLFNLFKGTTGLFIGLNAATAVTVGILGLPGFIMLLILQFIFR
jgi:inhibitor of the pro-sigma K processing machinery